MVEHVTGDTWPRELEAGLTLRVAQNAEDLERIAELHALVFEPSAAAFTRALAGHYPGVRPEDFVFVQDRLTGEAVSSLCLVPTTWMYEGVELRVAELGIVATHPDYRRAGLIREQMRWFEGQLEARQFDLSSIQGIPYFYRRFGYEYIIPMEGGYELRPEQVPEPLAADAGFGVRQATEEDIPLLQKLLAAAGQGLAVSLRRDPQVWRYQDDPRRTDEDALETYLVCDDEQPVGYFRLYRHETHSHSGVRLVEASPLPYRGCLAALRACKALAPQREYAQTIRVSLPPSSPLARMAGYLGGRWLQPYAWQVRIPNAVRFLKRIAPVLEQRLAASFLAGYNSFLRIDLYVDTIELDLQAGHVADVRSLGRLESRAVRLPWWAAWQLWLGHRSRAELCAWYPDARVDAALQPLVDALFPKRESWIFPTL